MRQEQFSKWLSEERPPSLGEDTRLSYYTYLRRVEEVLGNLDSKDIFKLEDILTEVTLDNFNKNEPGTMNNYKAAIKKYWKFREEAI